MTHHGRINERAKSRRGPLIAGVAGGVVLVAIIAVLATLLITSDNGSTEQSADPAETLTMPTVTGMTAGQAATVLRNPPYNLTNVQAAGGAAAVNSPVVGQQPAAGAPLTPSTAVALAIAPAGQAPGVTSGSGSGAPAGTISAGTYDVGTGPGAVAPGTYRTTGGRLCYWARRSNLSEDPAAIIDNGTTQGQDIMTIAPSDKYVVFRGTCTWSKR